MKELLAVEVAPRQHQRAGVWSSPHPRQRRRYDRPFRRFHRRRPCPHASNPSRDPLPRHQEGSWVWVQRIAPCWANLGGARGANSRRIPTASLLAPDGPLGNPPATAAQLCPTTIALEVVVARSHAELRPQNVSPYPQAKAATQFFAATPAACHRKPRNPFCRAAFAQRRATCGDAPRAPRHLHRGAPRPQSLQPWMRKSPLLVHCRCVVPPNLPQDQAPLNT
mmetsp:Transcript_87898/g.246896  ORF Transcript_87898/g.246896 Transcript_87898/m.246896 type:complete len:223 (+) Transcript_87898:250-918(+)